MNTARFDRPTLACVGALSLAALLSLNGCAPDEPEVVLVRIESTTPLILDVLEADQGEGYPVGVRRVLQPFTHPTRNIDHPGIPFPLPLSGEAVFRDVAVHKSARLDFWIGVEQVLVEEAAGADIEFWVDVRDGELRTRVYSDRLSAPEVGSPPVRMVGSAKDLSAFAGKQVDLVFGTRRLQKGLAAGGLIPSFCSPTLRSDGVEVDLAKRAIECPTVDQDLLRSPAAREALDPSFDAGFAGGGTWTEGAWPALGLNQAIPSVEIPVVIPSRPSTLEFLVGVHRQRAALAQFEIRFDGDLLHTERLDTVLAANDGAGEPTTNGHRGWHPREVDLTPYSGRSGTLTFQAETTPAEARVGFGRPRIVTTHQVPARRSSGDQPSVIVVNVETFRADAVGCYGGPEGVTPNLDAIAADGVRVEECFSIAPWTAPSVASLFTGLYPLSHGVRSMGTSFLSDAHQTLAESARASGIATVGLVTNYLVSKRKNFDQGFDSFLHVPYGNARQIVELFGEWVQDRRDVQFLAYLHLFEPHHPYRAPDDPERYVPKELRGQDPRVVTQRVQKRVEEGSPPSPEDDDFRYLRGRYLAEVHYLDQALGRLREILDEAGLSDRVVLVVSGDHGEEFGEHGRFGHGKQLYRESVHVPLVFHGPGVPEGKTLRGPVENVSLFNTVLQLLDAEMALDTARPPIRFDDPAVGGEAYSGTEFGAEQERAKGRVAAQHAMRTRDRFFLVPETTDGRDDARLFDVGSDPSESSDVASRDPDVVRDMRDRLDRAFTWMQRTQRGLGKGGLDAETRAALEQLGYLGTNHEE